MSIPTEMMPDGHEKTILLLSREINILREERDLLKEQLREARAVVRDWHDQCDEMRSALREIDNMSVNTVLEWPVNIDALITLIRQMGSVARKAIKQEASET